MNKYVKWIIITIICFILLGVICFYFVKKFNNNDLKDETNNSEKVSVKEESSKIETDTIWINEALGITYDLPKQTDTPIFNGSASFKYIHGSSFKYDSSYKIYVDKSLEGHTDLETLASDIIGEKQSKKYSFIYKFGSKFLKEFKNSYTKKVKIGNYNTVYFESEELDASSAFGKDIKIKIVGYSFKYNKEYISVYGELLVGDNSELRGLKEKMEYIIKTIKPYDEKSLQELNGNVRDYYDDGFTNSFNDNKDKTFTMNYHSDHSLNGILGHKDTVKYLNKDYFNWDGTSKNILNQLLTYKYATSSIDFYKKARNATNKSYETLYDILNEEVINVNGIDFNEYTLKVYYNTDKTDYKILVVYFFVVDDNPYLFQYSLNSSIYDEKPSGSLNIDEQKIVIEQTELVAKSYIHTFRLLNDGEEYSTYIDLF